MGELDPQPPTFLRDLSVLERRLGRRVQYARPPALDGVEVCWSTTWGGLIPARVDHRYLLTLIDESRSTTRCGRREFSLQEGMSTLTAPDVLISAAQRSSPFTRLRAIFLDRAEVDRVGGAGVSTAARRHPYVVRQGGDLQRTANALFEAVGEGEPALLQQHMLCRCVAAMSNALVDAPERTAERASARVRRALDLLHERYATDLTLPELAAAAGGDVHPRYLLTVFKREVGLAPYQYLLRLRVQRAQQLLARGERATDVALAVGFYDLPQLHRHFVKLTGTTPGLYARSVRSLAG